MFFNKEKFSDPLHSEGDFWFDDKTVLQLKSAWSVISDDDRPMIPCVISNSLELKISFVVHCSYRYFNKKVFIQYISKEDTVEDLFYSDKKNKIYSPFMSAIKQDQTLIICPIGSINQKIFSFLIPLLRGEKKIHSYIDGKRINVNKNFRLVTFLNETHLHYEISRDHFSLMMPKIYLDGLNFEDISKYLTNNKSFYSKELVKHITVIFNNNKGLISLDEAKNILEYVSKRYKKDHDSMNNIIDEAIELVKNNKKKMELKNFLKIGL